MRLSVCLFVCLSVCLFVSCLLFSMWHVCMLFCWNKGRNGIIMSVLYLLYFAVCSSSVFLKETDPHPQSSHLAPL
ncbi:hypothetical protein IWX50DRAFT_626919 [Phyllosticta citricarpa]